jgi:hypothetical protein
MIVLLSKETSEGVPSLGDSQWVSALREQAEPDGKGFNLV